MSKGLSIVISAYDRPRLFHGTLESVTALRVPPGTEAEILVVVSARMKEAPAIVAEANVRGGIPARLVPELQPGLSHARNQGLAEAAHDHVVFFDDDVEVAPDWIAGYFEALEKLGADCVVGPVNPKFEQAVPDYLAPATVEYICSPYSRRGPNMFLLPAEVAHEVPGCNFGVNKRVALDLGGFNPELGRRANELTAGEDSEFGARLVKAGKRVVYQPRCSIGHVISAEKLSKSWFRRRWYGDGVAQRIQNESRGSRLSAGRRLRGLLAVAWRFAASLGLTVIGKRSASFDYELKALAALAYLRGPNPRNPR
jgi:GT2 family glycosyltransferase